MTLKPLFQNTIILKRPTVAMFVDIIKIVTMFISTIFKDSKKGKRIRDYQNQNAVYICIA